MSRNRLLIFYLLLGILLVGYFYDAVTGYEHWPFSNFPMFADLLPQKVEQYEMFCLTKEHGIEKEIPLNPDWIPSLPMHNLQNTWRHYASGSKADPIRLKSMLKDMLDVYDARRRLQIQDGPPLSGLRLYLADLSKSVPSGKNGLIPSTPLVERRLVAEVDEQPESAR
jgi:hypothetical protein